MGNNTKGSEWRIWDLHIHTPKSINQNYGGEKNWDKFIEALERLPREIKVIGITDYYFIDGFQKVMRYKNSGRLGNIEKIFPILEFRIDTFGSGSENKLQKINLHILFNLNENDLEKEINKVNDEFIKQIPITKLDKHKTKMLSIDNLTIEGGNNLQTGFSDLIPPTDKVFELLSSNTWRDNTFTFLGYKEWSNLEKNNQIKPLKEDLYNKVSAFFSSNYETLNKSQDWLNEFGNKRLLHSGDIHDFDLLDTAKKDEGGQYIASCNYCCNTWIKADPTFEGLKQIIYEPQDRVFIGLRPEVLERVENHKTKYINSLFINQVPTYDESKGIWYKDVHIELNKELVCIIGNKGSGKSAITDIIGLLGNTHNSGKDNSHFSFLNKNKFLQKRLADSFEGILEWVDGEKNSNSLGISTNPENVERVRYLPQHFFETLTNDLEGEGFKNTLENVIFEHLPDQNKHGKLNFQELKQYKEEGIEKDIAVLKDEIININKTIVTLEEKTHTSFRAKIESELSTKKKELKEHERNRLEIVEVEEPFKDEGSLKEKSKKFDDIIALNSHVESLKQQIETKETKRKNLVEETEKFDKLLKDVKRFARQIDDYKKQNSESYRHFNLEIDKILSFKLDATSIEEAISYRKNQITELNNSLLLKEDVDAIDDNEKYKEISIPFEKSLAEEKIEKIKKELSDKEKEYQSYLDKVKKWEDRKKEIVGEERKTGTLKFFENQINYLDTKLDEEINGAKAKRIKITLQIYEKKSEIIYLFDKFKEPVEKLVAENKDYLQDYEINIGSSFKLMEKFSIMFFSYINQNKKGSFYGREDGDKKLIEIITEKDYNNSEIVETVLNDILQYLTNDKREDSNGETRCVADQIENVSEFYNFIFSLDYLLPAYELKLGDKQLSELSPGEKGTLLLVFYLMIGMENIPLIIDQPEDNLDNQSIFMMLREFIKQAKKKRQIIIVTHNPNLAVGADAEQIIHVKIDKRNNNRFTYNAGAIEDPVINKFIVNILEGTMPAFDKRKLKYLV
jgi:ABC-type lipoprotein export system ATPase subunit